MADRIAVFGAGGVGGYFAARLAQGGAEVHLVARGAHLDAIRRHGLEVRSVLGDATVRLPATDDPTEIGPCEHVLLCVKSYDTQTAAARLAPLVGPDTAVVSLQNGVDNEDVLARVIGEDHVLGGAAYIFAAIAAPGTVEHIGGPARIVLGELDGSFSDRARRLLDRCRAAGVEAALSENIRVELWQKFAFLCALAGMTAAARLPLGEIRDTPEAWTMFRRLVEEVVAVAAAERVPLPADAVEQHVRFAEGLEPGGFSSLHLDLTRGSRMELDALHGAVVRRGRAHGVPVPTNEAVYALLRPWALRAEASAAATS